MRDANVAVARRARFALHLRRMARTTERLRRNGRSESNVLAILAVEAFYRPRALRTIEYLVWFIRSLLNRPTAGGISVGIAQAKISNWHDLGVLDSERFSPRRLARVLDADANYEVCRRYLADRRMLDELDLKTLTAAYTGGSRRDYVQMLDEALVALAP